MLFRLPSLFPAPKHLFSVSFRCLLLEPLLSHLAPSSLFTYASMFFFSSRRRHTIYWRDWSSDVVLFRSSPKVVVPLATPSISASMVASGRSSTRMWRPIGPIACAIQGWTSCPQPRASTEPECVCASIDRKSVGEGKRVDLGGRRIIKKKN